MMSDLGLTRTVLSIVEVVGWAALVLFLLAAFLVSPEAFDARPSGGLSQLVARLILVAPAVIAALVSVAGARVGRAIVDGVEAATAKPARVDAIHPADRVKVYLGYEIAARGDKFMVAGQLVDSAAEAETYISRTYYSARR